MSVSPDVNYDELARSTDDFNAAQLKAVCVEAGILALRRDGVEVNHEDFVEGIIQAWPDAGGRGRRCPSPHRGLRARAGAGASQEEVDPELLCVRRWRAVMLGWGGSFRLPSLCGLQRRRASVI